MPTFRRAATPAESLSRYRDALVAGAPAEELARLAAPLDPELLETLHWARQAGQRARAIPDPRFASQLERELRRTFPASTGAQGQAAAMPTGSGAERDKQTIAPRAIPAPVFGPRWGRRSIGAAAALLLVVLGSLFALRFAPFEGPQSHLSATGEPTTETFIDAELTGAAATWSPLTVEHWRLREGAALVTIPPLDGPQWVVADGGRIVASVDGKARTLAAGEGLVVPAGQSLTLRNPDLGETSAFRGVATAEFSFEEYDRAVISKATVLDTEAHEALPPGQSHLVFDQLTIPPGTLVRAKTATGQDWFDIVTGRLGLTLIGDALPQGWESDREHELAAGDPVPVVVPGTNVTMRNVGDDPLVVLRLRVSPVANDAATAPVP